MVRTWLEAGLAATALFGVALILLPGPTQAGFNLMFFGRPVLPDGFTPEAARYVRFLYAVLGAVIAGFGVTMLLIARGPMRAGAPGAWRALAAGIGTWFVLDAGASLALGYWPNALLNLGFLMLLAVPLWRLR